MAFLFGMPFFGYSQDVVIEGEVFDSNSKVLSNCIIIASDTESGNRILGFNTSDLNGNFSLLLNNEIKIDSVWLTVRHISYETLRLKIPYKSCKKKFQLKLKTETLEEVVIKGKETISIKGDTITYNVNKLKSKKDVTIEDVIQKIPGVSIQQNGQIKYLDKPISHFYINGVDLLEGNYSIASQSIPADVVEEIDVMQKHHHERIHIGKTETDKVAFNLKIKKNAGLFFGSLTGDVGVPFLTGKLDATPIYFKDSFQNIASVKSNNIGKTLLTIGENLTSDNSNVGNFVLEDTQVITKPSVKGVAISDKYWLDNESYAITNDALHKVNDSTTVKWSFNYGNEVSKIEHVLSSEFLTNNQTSNIFSRNRNQLKTSFFNAVLNQEINKRKFYLKNATSYKYGNNTGIERVTINNNYLESNYHQNNFQINNSTNFKTIIDNKNIFQSGILVQYLQNSEELLVSPPIFETILGSTNANDFTKQQVQIRKFNLVSFSQYNCRFLKLEWNLNQNLNFHYFSFDSNLKQESNLNTPIFPLSSDFNYQKFTSTTKLNSKTKIGKLTLSWNLSLDYIDLHTIENKSTPLSLTNSFVFIQPDVALKYNFNSKWKFGVNYSFDTKISDFSQLYTPTLLTSYNTITQNPNFINVIRTNSFLPSINYSNILDSFYFSLKGNLNQIKSDVTFSNELNSEGFITTNVIERPNYTHNYGYSLYFTKGFLGSFKTDFNYSFNIFKNQLFFNNQFLNAFNRRNSFDFSMSWDKGSWFSIEYKAKLNLGTSETESNKISNSFLFQNLNLDFYTSNKTRLSLSFESSKTTSSLSSKTNVNSLFNMAFYYKPSKKLNVNVSILNILNTRFFSTTNSYLNFVNEYQFSLRPRQLTLGLHYSL